MRASVCSGDMPPPVSLTGFATLPSLCILSSNLTGAKTISSSMRSKPFLMADCTIGSTRSSSAGFGVEEAPRRDQKEEEELDEEGAEGCVE